MERDILPLEPYGSLDTLGDITEMLEASGANYFLIVGIPGEARTHVTENGLSHEDIPHLHDCIDIHFSKL